MWESEGWELAGQQWVLPIWGSPGLCLTRAACGLGWQRVAVASRSLMTSPYTASVEPRAAQVAALEALPEASAPLTSASRCFGARAGEEGVSDKGSAHRLPAGGAVWRRWQQRWQQQGRLCGCCRQALCDGRTDGRTGPCGSGRPQAMVQSCGGRGALVFNGFLSRLQFPLLPLAVSLGF